MVLSSARSATTVARLGRRADFANALKTRRKNLTTPGDALALERNPVGGHLDPNVGRGLEDTEMARGRPRTGSAASLPANNAAAPAAPAAPNGEVVLGIKGMLTEKDKAKHEAA